jgi:hypothetical protein
MICPRETIQKETQARKKEILDAAFHLRHMSDRDISITLMGIKVI